MRDIAYHSGSARRIHESVVQDLRMLREYGHTVPEAQAETLRAVADGFGNEYATLRPVLRALADAIESAAVVG